MGFNLHLFVLLLCAVEIYCAENGVVWKTYKSATPVFQILISSSKKNLFVAAGNKLIQLNTSLSLDREVNMHANESHRDEGHGVTMLLSHKSCLLVCSSGVQGICHMHNEKNISHFISYISWGAISHTVGTGKAIAVVSELSRQKSIFYVAKHYDGTDLNSFGYMISATEMHPVNHSSCGFNIFTSYVRGLSPHPNFIYSSNIRYIYGFDDQNFVYFLLTQKLSEDSYQTRLARVCHEDITFKSYSEIPLVCLATTNQTYNLAITGYLDRRAEDEDGVNTEILYIAFGNSEHGQDPEDSFGTILCSFHLDEVRMTFYNATRDCLEGVDGAKRIKTLLGGDYPCEKVNVISPERIEKALCDPGKNYYVEGRTAMVGLTVASLNQVAVSLSVIRQHDHTVAFLITKHGFIAKYVLEPSAKRGLVYNVLVDDDAQPEVRSSHVLDKNEKNMYLLSGNKVIRFPIASCLPHPNCASCVAKRDPLGCGWCRTQCAAEDVCFPKGDKCPPVVNQSSQVQAENEEMQLASSDAAISSEKAFPRQALWPTKIEPILEAPISPNDVFDSRFQSLFRGAVVAGTIAVMSLLCLIALTIHKLGFIRFPCWFERIRTFYPTWYTAKDHVQEETLQDVCSDEQIVQNWHENQGESSWFKNSEETICLLSDVQLTISREFVTLRQQIGQGHFGCIYEGELKIPANEDVLQVAVKTLHNCRHQETGPTKSFLQEGLLMKDFRHRNVLTLIGVCFEETRLPMIILPFMKNGDMKTYIENEENKPTIKDLMKFGVQVAEGMQYLSELNCIHRDLAARNCLLDENLTVKVADFGLTRDHHEYYRSRNNKSKLPIKWMAPESLEKGTFSNKSDVWSFGVLLWELMTRGMTPYPQVGNWEILEYIQSGRRMFKPLYCPDMLYGIMCRCWNDNPKKRPKFSELAVEIRDVIKKMRREKKNIVLNVTYYNVPNPGKEDGLGNAV